MPNVTIEKTVENMNSLPAIKYGLEPDKIEKRSLESEWFREWFDIICLSRISKAQPRYERYQKKGFEGKEKSLEYHLKLVKVFCCCLLELRRKVLQAYFIRAA